jgi:hypothetical protein
MVRERRVRGRHGRGISVAAGGWPGDPRPRRAPGRQGSPGRRVAGRPRGRSVRSSASDSGGRPGSERSSRRVPVKRPPSATAASAGGRARRPCPTSLVSSNRRGSGGHPARGLGLAASSAIDLCVPRIRLVARARQGALRDEPSAGAVPCGRRGESEARGRGSGASSDASGPGRVVGRGSHRIRLASARSAASAFSQSGEASRICIRSWKRAAARTPERVASSAGTTVCSVWRVFLGRPPFCLAPSVPMTASQRAMPKADVLGPGDPRCRQHVVGAALGSVPRSRRPAPGPGDARSHAGRRKRERSSVRASDLRDEAARSESLSDRSDSQDQRNLIECRSRIYSRFPVQIEGEPGTNAHTGGEGARQFPSTTRSEESPVAAARVRARTVSAARGRPSGRDRREIAWASADAQARRELRPPRDARTRRRGTVPPPMPGPVARLWAQAPARRIPGVKGQKARVTDGARSAALRVERGHVARRHAFVLHRLMARSPRRSSVESAGSRVRGPRGTTRSRSSHPPPARARRQRSPRTAHVRPAGGLDRSRPPTVGEEVEARRGSRRDPACGDRTGARRRRSRGGLDQLGCRPARRFGSPRDDPTAPPARVPSNSRRRGGPRRRGWRRRTARGIPTGAGVRKSSSTDAVRVDRTRSSRGPADSTAPPRPLKDRRRAKQELAARLGARNRAVDERDPRRPDRAGAPAGRPHGDAWSRGRDRRPTPTAPCGTEAPLKQQIPMIRQPDRVAIASSSPARRTSTDGGRPHAQAVLGARQEPDRRRDPAGRDRWRHDAARG